MITDNLTRDFSIKMGQFEVESKPFSNNHSAQSSRDGNFEQGGPRPISHLESCSIVDEGLGDRKFSFHLCLKSRCMVPKVSERSVGIR